MAQEKWRNRIVGHGEVPPESLLANEWNWRIHPRYQQDAVEAALDEVGWVEGVIVNKRTSEEWGSDQNVETVVDGHLRVASAISRHEITIPVEYVDLTPREEKLILTVLDPTTAMAGTDKDKLAELLAQVDAEEAGLRRLLGELREKTGAGGGGGDQVELEISPELFERHDYVVILVDNEFDWNVLCQELEIKQVACGPVGHKTVRQKGLGRVVPAERLLRRLGH